jgi:hypothetical protein
MADQPSGLLRTLGERLKNSFDFLQKIGKSLMLPVSVLPVAGILLGVGGALLSGVERGALRIESPLLLLLFQTMKSSGEPIFAGLPLIFAIGVALVVLTAGLVPGVFAGEMAPLQRAILACGVGVFGVLFVAVAARIVGIVGVSSQPTSGIALVTLLGTASVFAAAELTRNTASAKIEVFSEGYGRNDLQPVASARHPDIAVALQGLAKHAPHARMTGSGACVFAPFGSVRQASAALAARPPGFDGFVARTLTRHPLAGFA